MKTSRQTLLLLDRVALHSRQQPREIALKQVGENRNITWQSLHTAAAQLSRELRTNLSPGSVVLLVVENEPAFIAAYLGILLADLKVFPLTPESTSREITAAAATSGAEAIVASQTTFEQSGLSLRNWTNRQIDEMFTAESAGDFTIQPSQHAAMLLNSSGTTSEPKVVHRGAFALNAVTENCWQSVDFNESDHVLAAVPLCHSFGVEHGLLAPLAAGSCVHLCRGFDLPLILDALRNGITILPGVPFLFEAIAHQAASDLPGLKVRHAYSAGAPLPAAVAASLQTKLRLPLGQVYGCTEVGSVTFSNPQRSDFNSSSAGQPMNNVHIKLHPDSGEVVIRADSMFDQYLNCADPLSGTDLTASALTDDGYFRTGDLGRFDAHGNLCLTGRLKLLIDVGGQKVNPLEVEQVLCEHPAVAECVVLPFAISETVTRLKAIVVARGSLPPTAEELRRFAKQRLSVYKVPRVFELRQSLPRSPAGKVLRQQIEPVK